MKLFAILALTLFSGSAFAIQPNMINFGSINLEGLQIIDKDQQDTFQYMIKKVAKPTKKLIRNLQAESNSLVVSPIFELNQVSSFKNVYVYVGKTEEGTYELVRALVNRSGSVFIIDQDITSVEKDSMEVVHGVAPEQEKFTVKSLNGTLFP